MKEGCVRMKKGGTGKDIYPLTGQACRRLPRVGLRRGHGGDLLRAAGKGIVGHWLMLGIPLAHRSVLETSLRNRARASSSSWPPAEEAWPPVPRPIIQPKRVIAYKAQSSHVHKGKLEGLLWCGIIRSRCSRVPYKIYFVRR